jgi:Tfp pilus assembly protein PilV
MNTEAMIAIFALAAALGLLGVIAVDAFTIQKVDASGCRTSIAFNASQGYDGPLLLCLQRNIFYQIERKSATGRK